MDTKKNKTTNYLAPSLLEQQEHLSKDLLNTIINLNNKSVLSEDALNSRPKSSFVDLMTWVNDWFSIHLKDNKDINKYVHNRVIIDGQFVHFCKENNVTIQCLHKDSIISFKERF